MSLIGHQRAQICVIYANIYGKHEPICWEIFICHDALAPGKLNVASPLVATGFITHDKDRVLWCSSCHASTCAVVHFLLFWSQLTTTSFCKNQPSWELPQWLTLLSFVAAKLILAFQNFLSVLLLFNHNSIALSDPLRFMTKTSVLLALCKNIYNFYVGETNVFSCYCVIV